MRRLIPILPVLCLSAVSAFAQTPNYAVVGQSNFSVSIADNSGNATAGDTLAYCTGSDFAMNGTSCMKTTIAGATFTAGTSLWDFTTPTSLLASAGTYVFIEASAGVPYQVGSTFTVFAAPPTLTSVTPNTALAGQSSVNVTLAGTFPAVPTVNWTPTGGSAQSLTIVGTPTRTSIVATVPAGLIMAAGSAGIVVQDSGGATVTSSKPFTINALTLSSIAPSSAVAGQALNVSLTLTGSNFPSTSTVLWNGSATGISNVVVAGSGNSITATVNAATLLGTAGTVNVTVQDTVTSVVSAARTFTINPAPTFTSVSPNSGVAGQSNISVTLTGTNFPSTAQVFWNGSVLATYAWVSATGMTATIPTSLLVNSGLTPVTFPITVRDSVSGVATGAQNFTVNPAPNLTGLSPSGAVVNQSANVAITLTGTNFPSTAQVFWNGSVLATYAWVSATGMTATIPTSLLVNSGLTPVTFPITVRDSVSGVATGAQNFTVNPAPNLTGLSPSGAVVNQSANVAITLTGTNFPNTSTVLWNGTSGLLTNISVVASGIITATVPSTLLTATGTIPVSVRDTASGVTTGTQNFVINPPPTITSVAPSNVTAGAAGTITVTISGTNFYNGATITWCSFCSGSPTSLPTNFINTTTVQAQIPASDLSAAGTAQLGVIGGSTTATFTINPKPTLNSVTASGGSVVAGQAGATLNLSGTNLPVVSSPNSTYINFTLGGNTSQLTVNAGNSGTAATVAIPANLIATAGTAMVTIADSFSGVSSNAVSLAVIPPAVNSITPTSTQAGQSSNLSMTVTGSNFLTSSVVTWNGSTSGVTTMYVSATQLTATISSSLLTSAGTAMVGVSNVSAGVSAPATQTQTFTINSGPVLTTTTSPAFAAVGQAQFSLTLTGTNLPTSGTQVVWQLGAAPSTLSGASITTNTATMITVTIPASYVSTAGTASIYVTDTLSGVHSNTITFSVGSGALSSVAPTSAPVGSNPFTLVVNGSNFNSSSVVTWKPASASATTLTPTSFSSTTLTVTVPSNLLTSTGVITITVSNGSTLDSGSVSFTITSAPSISTLNPSSAIQGQANISNLVIIGGNFAATPIVNWTMGGSTTPLAVSSGSTSNQISVAVPSVLLTSAGNATITVTDATSGVTSTGFSFPIAAPTVSAVGPAATLASNPNPVTITVNGTNFISPGNSGNGVGSVVTFTPPGSGTTPVALTTGFGSSTQLTATIPTYLLTSSGTAQIGVIGGSTTATFTINPKPTLNSVTASGGSVVAGQAGATLNLSGTNLPVVSSPNSTYINFTLGGNTSQLTVNAGNSGTAATVAIPANLIATAGTAMVTIADSFSGVSSNAVSLAVIPPAVNSITPTSTQAGQSSNLSMTVTGSNFLTSSVVTWNGSTSGVTTMYVSATQLTATISSSLLTSAGTAMVGVSNVSAGVSAPATQTQTFTINSGPVLTTTTSPAFAAVGQAQFSLTLTGTNLPTSGTQVVWQLGAAPSTLSGASITTNTATMITVTIPASYVSTAGTASIYVTDTLSGVHSNTITFSVGSGALSSVAPTSAPVGSNPFTLVVNGSNFNSSSVVTWKPASASATTLTPTSFSSTTLTVTVPSNLLTSTGVITITVSNGSTLDSGSVSFTITSAPSISTLNPSSAIQGQANISNLVIIGGNFAATPIVNWTMGGSTTPLAVSSGSTSNQISVAVPSVLLTSAGNATITVTDATSGVTSTGFSFPIAAPTVSAVGPAATLASNPNPVTITVNGTNFISPGNSGNGVGSVVTFTPPGSGTTPVALTTGFGSSTQLTATIPTYLLTSSGTAQIGVSNTSTVSAGSFSFTISSPLTLTSVSPNSATAGAKDQTLTLTGTFPNSISPVVNWKVGNTTTNLLITASMTTTTSITATLPATLITAGQTATISVTDSITGVSSASLPFTVNGPVLSSAVTAAGSPVAGVTYVTAGANQTTLTLTGSNFITATNSNSQVGSIVTWCLSGCNGGAPSYLTPSNITSTSITVIIPASFLSTSGTVAVGVVNSPGLNPTFTQTFTINAGPTISSVTPSSVIEGPTSDLQIVLRGTGFPTSNLEVDWTLNGTTHPLVIAAGSTSTTITATISKTYLTTSGTATIVVKDNSQGVVSPAFNFTVASGPAITGVNPATLILGSTAAQTLTINGTNFVSGDTVSWTPAGGLTTTLSQPTGTVPAGTSYISSFGAGGTSIVLSIDPSLLTPTVTAAVVVNSSSGGQSSNSQNVTIGAPTITAISPTGTTAGSTTATIITVNGSNFLSNSVVTWCLTGCGTPTNLTTTYVSSTQLTATVPVSLLAASGTAAVGVTNGTYASTGTQSFTLGSISLSQISPTSASAGSTGISITLSGTSFTSSSTVLITVGSTTTTLTSTFLSSTSMTAVIPATLLVSPGTGSIFVQSGSTVSASQAFTISPPTLTSVSVTSSIAGVTTPITVHIMGSNFVSASTAYWNNGSTNTALSTTYQDSTDLVAIVTSAQLSTPGSALITVQNSTAAVSSPEIFSVGQSPTISTSGGLSPATLPAGSPAAQLVITGTNFASSSVVTWNNSGTSTTLVSGYVSSTQLTATIPATLLANAGSALVIVSNGTVSSNAATFSIGAGTVPTLTSISPTAATAGGSQFQLTLLGTNFVSGSTVQWNNGSTTASLPAAMTGGGTTLTAVVPASDVATAGNAFVSVLNPGGGTSSQLTFVISSNLPTVTSLGTTSAVVGSASFQLTVSGTNFVPSSVVNWNAGNSAVPLQTIYNSSTSLTAIIPAANLATVGSVTVTVANPGATTGTTVSSNSLLFSVTPLATPSINTTSGLTPASVVAGTASFPITIAGSNFFSGSTVQWIVGSSTTQLATTYINSSQLSAVVTASLASSPVTAYITVTNPGNSISNQVSFAVTAAAGPTISSLSSTSAIVGSSATQITVTGSNFVTGSLVQWNGGSGAVALQTIYNTATSLTAIVPAADFATAGLAIVTVTNPGTTSGTTVVSNSVVFTITAAAPPTISSVSVTSAVVGSSALQVTVTGTNFVAGSTVQWNSGTSATSVQTVYSSSTSLTALIPSSDFAVAGVFTVTVSNAGASGGSTIASNAIIFTVTSAGTPSINSTNGVSPSTAVAGSTSFSIAINGSNFYPGSTVQWISGSTTSQLPTFYISATQLSAIVTQTLAASVVTALVTVTNPGGSVSNLYPFTVTASAAPTISTISSTSAVVGSAALQITITGTNFISGSVVQWSSGSSAPTSLLTSVNSASTLTAVIPASNLSAVGSFLIDVSNPGANSGATATSSSVIFNVTAAGTPSINSTSGLSPSSVAVGSAGFTLTINGTNFFSGSTVQWTVGSAITQLSTTYVSSTQLTAVVTQSLAASPASASITVTNPGGAVSNLVTFTVTAAAGPTISSLGTTSATVGSSALQITVTGANFVSGSSVLWSAGTNATPLQTIYNSSTSLTAVIPAIDLATAGIFVITVTNPGSTTGTTVSSNAVVFTVGSAAAPTISSLSTTSAQVASSSIQLSVTGTNFVSGSLVQWNAGTTPVTLQTIYVSSTSLTAFIPASNLSSAGSFVITVTNPGASSGSSVSSNAIIFTITTAGSPSINSANGLSPASVVVGSTAFSVAITGSNFVSGSTVQWIVGSNTTQLPVSYVDSSHLSAVVSQSLASLAGTAFITVTNPGGAVSNLVAFSVTAAATPTISTSNGLLPSSSVAAGSAAFQMIVVGTGFVSGSTVYWNNGTQQALTTSYVSSIQLAAVVPASLISATGVAFVSVQNPGTPVVNSNSVAFAIGTSATLPTLSALSPSTIPAGSPSFPLQLSGTNFQNGATVQWNGGSSSTTATISTGFGSSSVLTALIPSNLVAAPGTALVSVTNPDKSATNSLSFSISGSVPVLTQLSPSLAAAGTPSLTLLVTGSGFSSGAVVMWGTTALPTTFSSSTQLMATVSSVQLGSAGNVSVTVQSSGGTSNSASFSVAAPIITLLSPATVTAGGPSFTITVGGDNFVAGDTIGFGGTVINTVFVSANQLTGTVPASLIATANSISVAVYTASGAMSTSFSFPVGSVPNISSISPASAAPGSPAFTLSVNGTNFANGDTVQWNGVALVTTYGSATALSAAVPANLITNSGSVNVSVLHAGGVVSNAVQFTITSATLTSISPTSAPAGSATLQLTVNGTAFVNGSTVQWNGTALPTTFVSATQLSASVNSSLMQSVGSSFITVTNPGGSSTSGVVFNVAGPTLTSISPTSATAGSSGLTITFTGTNFVSNSVATWNGATLPTVISGATQASATISASQLAAAGTFIVTVTNPGGTTTGGQFFTVNAPAAAVISGLSPSSAIAGGSAFQLTVAGSGFVTGSVVEWNGTAIATSYVGPTQLTALISSNLIGSAGTANITVLVPGATLSAATQFPINPPAITTLSPATVSAGGPTFTLTVSGGNFIPGSSVQWNGTSLPTIYNSATQLSASVASSLITAGGTASITVQNAVGAASSAVTFTIGPFTLAIGTTTLPDAVVGTNYSQVLSATGGSPPYSWTVSSGSLPTGITLDSSSGTVSGIASAAVVGTVGFTVTDSVARAVTKSIPFRAVAPLNVTTSTPLTSAPAGVPFSQILAATGGTSPYTWAVAGSLPPGLVLNTSTGQISGTPTVPGAYNFTINISDTRQLTASVPFSQTITATGITIGGITTTATSGQQIPINVTVSTPYSVPITGSLTLVFTSAVGATDPSIQFSTGGLTTNFTIPAGTTQAVFGTQQSVILVTGTIAGSITITGSVQVAGASVTPTSAPTVTTVIAKAPPVITSATLTASGTNLVVSLAGYSNTRDMTTGSFQFTAAPGSTLTAAPISVNLASTFAAWYQSSSSANFGSQFTISLPFSFSGSLSAIGGVSVTLTNSAGTSASVTATRQ